jgi:lycopene cyclase CruA
VTVDRARFPLTDEAFGARPDGADVLAHLAELERDFLRKDAVTIEESGGPDGRADFDVAIAGGGLSLIYAAYLARAGLKVAVFDRRQIGCGHREWNISRAELGPLMDSGLFSAEEVERLIELEYERGIVRWFGGGTYPVRHVLDCVVASAPLLDGLRARAAAAGATLLSFSPLAGYCVGKGGVEVRLGGARPTTLTARLLIDGMGAQSPHAAYDLCCPTVGGVLTELEAGDADRDPQVVDPRLGEILVTTENVEEGRQHIWEGFPQPGGRFTTYLFYYTEPAHLPEHPLFSLYERFFATRPRYKRGRGLLERPTYGFIPAYSRLTEMPTAPRDRVILVGDAAGRHSPLTFCGFGSMIRSFRPVADALRDRLEHDRLDRTSLASVWREPAGLQVMGGLTLMMVEGRTARAAGDVNLLLDAAFASLSALGEETFAAFVRDEIGFADFIRFMRATAHRHPAIYDEVFAQLTRSEILTWTGRLGKLALGKWSSGA